jgi:hypothetical protein
MLSLNYNGAVMTIYSNKETTHEIEALKRHGD